MQQQQNPERRKFMLDFLQRLSEGKADINELTNQEPRYEINMNLSGEYEIDGKKVSFKEYVDYAERNSSINNFIITLKI